MTDEDTLDILMTSDFNDDLKKSEWISLLFKFRNFYKNLYNNYQKYKLEKEKILSDKDIYIKNIEKKNSDLIKDNDDLKSKLNSIYNRKLTLRERLSGRIRI